MFTEYYADKLKFMFLIKINFAFTKHYEWYEITKLIAFLKNYYKCRHSIKDSQKFSIKP